MKTNKSIKIKCDNCGKFYKVTKYKYQQIKKQAHHYCCKKCSDKGLSKYRSGENSPYYMKRIKVKCSFCNKMIERTKYLYKLNKIHFCNIKCYSKWQSKNRCGEKSFSFKKKIWNKCIYCGKKFSRRPRKYKFCGKKCHGKWKSKYLVAEKSPNYINGNSRVPYIIEFNNSLKEQIRERDHYKCQYPNCKITQKKSIIKWKEKLHIHHIDYNKNHADPKRLITLCKSCNCKVNSERDYWYAYFMYILERKNNG